MSLSVHKLTSRIGAVVEGVDLAAEPSGEVIAALRDALSEHKVIVFDGVALDDAGQERVASWFGELTAAHGRPVTLVAFTITGAKIVAIDLTDDPHRIAEADLAILDR